MTPEWKSGPPPIVGFGHDYQIDGKLKGVRHLGPLPESPAPLPTRPTCFVATVNGARVAGTYEPIEGLYHYWHEGSSRVFLVRTDFADFKWLDDDSGRQEGT